MQPERLLYELIADAVERHGDRCAIEIPASDVREPRHRVTYTELDAHGERIRALLAPFVTGECVVAILLPRTSTQLFAAQLGVLRAGAAFVCIDVDGPSELVEFVLENSQAVVVATDAAGRAMLEAANLADREIVDVHMTSNTVPARPDWLTPASLAYIVYTSGTTGRPKGVMIEHRSIAHLIRTDVGYFGIGVTDRCVLASSAVYDSSIEEAWLPLAAGATVVVADEETVRLGPDLVGWLRDVRATVLMPTPTLLRMTACADPSTELPDLRLVYAGGEAFPQDLADRWGPGRWLENGYGPTECTVTVVRTRLEAGRPVTIGRPIPGNWAWVLDDALVPVADGEVGELCISGVQVARGYWNAPELTEQHFPTVADIGRVYRTGDLVRRDEHNDLEYLGRADSQVKLRGYRIELEQIEAQLASIDGVNAAACRVAKLDGSQQLEAFFVPSAAEFVPTSEQLTTQLRGALPSHMVPVRFRVIDRLPTTAGGKLDRKSLPAPEHSNARDGVKPRDELEATVARALAAPFGFGELGIDDDFFALGGDSLSVAFAVSELRAHEDTAGIAARDIYELRTVRQLAASVRARTAPRERVVRKRRDIERGDARPMLVTCAQTIVLTLGLAVASMVAYVLVLWVAPWLLTTVGVVPVLVLSPLALIVATAAYIPLALAIAVGAKWLLIGRYTARRTAVWSGFYLRHWIVVRVVGIVPWSLLRGTVFFNAALRALGAHIGRRVHVHRGVDLLGGGWDLLDIGDDVTLSQDASVGLVQLEDGELVLGPVRLESGCTLEVRAGVGAHTVVGECAELSALSYLPSHATAEANSRYVGIPAQRVGAASEPPAVASQGIDPRLHGLTLIAVTFGMWIGIAIPGLLIAIVLWSMFGVDDRRAADWVRDPWGSMVVCTVLIVLAGLSLAARHVVFALVLRWTTKVPSGSIDRWSLEYIRVWLRTGVLESVGRWLSGTLFWRWWLQLAGMRLGNNVEVSTIIDVLPELVSIGDESFFADGVYLCGPEVKRGVVTTASVNVGARVFLGNHVVVPPGARVPSDVLLGVATVVDASRMRADSSWFGHPAFELPRREIVAYDRTLTHDPSRALYLHRLAWEALRYAIPSVLMLTLLAWIQLASLGFGFAVLASISVGVARVLAVCALKWVLLGRVRPGKHGFWSCWVARWDFLYMAWGMIARGVLTPFGGTLWLPWYLRAMGVRVGRRVVLGGEFAQVVDPDMLEFGDHATIDRPMVQAHSFEDRVLKIDRVVIERAATVGRATVLFYGASLGAGCLVAPHSVVMKGERLMPSRSYVGAPTRLDRT